MLISTILVTWFIFLIIRFGRDNHNRTLINQFISDIMWLGITWNLVIEPITFYRYVVGPPHGHFLCSLDSILRNGLCMHGLLLFDCIVVSRFLLVHYIKNPTALHDDFLNLFTNACIFAFWVIAQTVYIIIPGKNPINYYMCIGTYPNEYQGQPVKANHILFFVVFFSIALHVMATMVDLKLKDTFEQKSFFSKLTNNVGIISFIFFSSALPTIINLKEPEELDQYPNYLLVYSLHLFVPRSHEILVGLAYICKHSPLRNHLFGKTKNVFKKCCCRENEVVVIT